jgi:hypothetical protein
MDSSPAACTLEGSRKSAYGISKCSVPSPPDNPGRAFYVTSLDSFARRRIHAGCEAIKRLECEDSDGPAVSGEACSRARSRGSLASA